MQEQEQLRDLLTKQMNGTLTPSEQEALDELIGDCSNEELSKVLEEVFAEVTDIDASYYEHDWEAIRKKIVALPQPVDPQHLSSEQTLKRPPVYRLRVFRYAVAAMLIIAISIFVVNMFIHRRKSDPVARNGNMQPGPSVTNCGLVEPTANDLKKDRRLIHLSIHGDMHTLSISPGWQFHTTLPDGSTVVLNAASSVTYPGSFDGRTKREVEVKGEVFFDVAQNARQPFFVKAKGMVLQALGTSFNVNAYGDKDSVYTTLVSGSLRIIRNSISSFRASARNLPGSSRGDFSVARSSLPEASSGQALRNDGVVLKPGERAAVALDDSVSIKVDKANLSATGMWREGYFSFNQSRIDEVMRELSRWYKWEISFAPDAKPVSFSGTFCRRTPEAEVLQTLRDKGIRFEKTGNKLLIQ